MNVGNPLLILVVAALVIGVGRVLLPLLWAVVWRSVMHGPAGVGSPNSGGRWFGWIVSLFWSVSEGKREEQWEYMRQTRPDRWDDGKPKAVADPLPQAASDAPLITASRGDWLMSRDHQQLTEDGNHWWSGREWVPASRFVPPSAPRSIDGSHWWDGADWRWVPNEFPSVERFLPRAAATPAQPLPMQESWLIRRRGHIAARWVPDSSRPLADRSDPPPRGLPPIANPFEEPAERRRRRWRKQR